MNYLAIDTSGRNLTVLACKNDTVTAFYDDECGVNHSVELMPRIEQICERANLDIGEVDFIACVVGAGSFTGIRIGVATVKAMCYAYKKPCLSITSFDTLAYNEKGGKVLALIDAKHNGFYACGYDNLKVCQEPTYIMREQVLELIKDYTPVCSTVIDGIDAKLVSVAQGLKLAVNAKQSEISFDLDSLVPLYVRKSQAEEGR